MRARGLLLVLVVAALAGCGMKGDLYLPRSVGPAAPATPTTTPADSPDATPAPATDPDAPDPAKKPAAPPADAAPAGG